MQQDIRQKEQLQQHVKICKQHAMKVIDELETKLKDAETKNQSLVDALIGKAPDSQSNQLLEMLSRKDTMIREKDAEIARLNQQLQCSGQTNVNITNNVTVNIVFGKESLDHIRPVDVLELMEKRSPKSVAAFIMTQVGGAMPRPICGCTFLELTSHHGPMSA